MWGGVGGVGGGCRGGGGVCVGAAAVGRGDTSSESGGWGVAGAQLGRPSGGGGGAGGGGWGWAGEDTSQYSGVSGVRWVLGGGARRFWLVVGGAVVCLGVFRATGDGGPGSSRPTGGGRAGCG